MLLEADEDGGEQPPKVENVPHVSKIELRGFKSFGNAKVSIPLSSGLTAIVGPNGSGKSNVVDALCFVLGRMSAKLMRAERFSDLLFNGGNGQRPAPFAEVSLHFNNDDGALPVSSNVAVISRRVDRSGKCVYWINRKRATRQEIVDLLSKHMSSPGGYNFIMQGDVDHFIKMDPFDRRTIIDDLAGVAEYDEKKQRSLSELQRVETNLNSMGAVLGEISTQMEKLRAEREGAIRHRELKQELKHTRAALLSVRRAACRKKLSRIQQRIKVKGGKLQELRDMRRKLLEEAESYGREAGRLQDLIERKRGVGALEVGKIHERLRVLSQLLDSDDRERTKIEDEIAEINTRIKKIGHSDEIEKIASLSSQFGDLHAKFNRLTQTLDLSKPHADIEKTLRELCGVLDEINSVLGALSEHLGHAPQFINTARSLESPSEFEDGFQLHRRLLDLNARHSQLEGRLNQLRQQVQETQAQLDRSTALEKEGRSSIEALRKEREKLQCRAGSLKGKAGHLEAAIEQLGDELQACKVEEASLRPQLENIEGELKQIKVGAEIVRDVDPAKLERRVGALEAELEALGPVNFRAIQDFRNTERRYNSEKLKHDKLVAERQALLDFMREIDEKKKEVFMQTFNEISQHFSKIFCELSPGGVARMALGNEENPFEGGLEIEANPAGKDVRVGALSGGERALTALAFIFALQRYRPTTLYVLDEIDAHLDDQNLRRVAELIQRSSRESQVILVTLRDSMMSVADRLFGVTMDKNKMSRLFSVELAGLAA
jgi:chromosome segregation ATPase